MSIAAQPGAEQGDEQLDEQQGAEHGRGEAQAGAHRTTGRRGQLHVLADVGDDEHVQDHHRARVDDDLGRGEELGAQQQEQDGEEEQVHDERQHRQEGVAQGDDTHGPGDRADRADEEEDGGHGAGSYSPSARRGVRSSGSASSISLVKMRSERL